MIYIYRQDVGMYMQYYCYLDAARYLHTDTT